MWLQLLSWINSQWIILTLKRVRAEPSHIGILLATHTCATFYAKTNIIPPSGDQILDKVGFGVFLPFYSFQTPIQPHQIFSCLRNIVLECERLGYHSVWIDDHLMYGKTPLLESWSTLAALASITSHIRLGTMVTSAAFRNPAVLAKVAATVDTISNGRLVFGIGAGVQKEEHEANGFTFPEPRVRVSRMREAVEIIKALWAQEKTTYKGKHYEVNGAVCEPKPMQKPHPPITVGGGGEKFTLKVTAQYADRADFGYLTRLEDYEHKLEVLENHCKAVGRQFAKIEKSCWPTGQIILGKSKRDLDEKISHIKPKTVSREDYEKYTFAGTPDEFVEVLQPYRKLGATHFMLSFADLLEMNSLRAFAKCANPELN
jgi:F420-dependent oxidoreductase-like protein